MAEVSLVIFDVAWEGSDIICAHSTATLAAKCIETKPEEPWGKYEVLTLTVDEEEESSG